MARTERTVISALDRIGREQLSPIKPPAFSTSESFQRKSIERNTGIKMAEQGTVKWFNDAKDWLH